MKYLLQLSSEVYDHHKYILAPFKWENRFASKNEIMELV